MTNIGNTIAIKATYEHKITPNASKQANGKNGTKLHLMQASKQPDVLYTHNKLHLMQASKQPDVLYTHNIRSHSSSNPKW